MAACSPTSSSSPTSARTRTPGSTRTTPTGSPGALGNHVRPVVHGRRTSPSSTSGSARWGRATSSSSSTGAGPRPAAHRRPGSTVSATFTAAARRGVDVRGCSGARTGTGSASTPRSHGCSASRSTRPAAVPARHAGADRRAPTTRSSSCCATGTTPAATSPTSVASTCAPARDGIDHEGDRQASRCRRRSAAPAVARRARRHDRAGGLRRRDRPSASGGGLHAADPQPGRLLSSLTRGRTSSRGRCPRRRRRPAPDGAHEAVQVLRTYPRSCPRATTSPPRGSAASPTATPRPSATHGASSTSRTSTCGRRRSGGTSATALRDNPGLRQVAVIPLVPDVDGAVSLPPQLYGRKLAMDHLLEAGGDRVAVYGLTSEGRLPGLRPRQGLRHRRRLGERRVRQLQPAVVVERLRGRLRRAGHAGGGPRGPAPRDVFALRLRGSSSASTSASTPTTCPTTTTRCGTSWRPRPPRSTSGMPPARVRGPSPPVRPGPR